MTIIAASQRQIDILVDDLKHRIEDNPTPHNIKAVLFSFLKTITGARQYALFSVLNQPTADDRVYVDVEPPDYIFQPEHCPGFQMMNDRSPSLLIYPREDESTDYPFSYDNIHSYIGLPVMVNNEFVGVLEVINLDYPNHLEQQAAIIQTVIDEVAPLLEGYFKTVSE